MSDDADSPPRPKELDEAMANADSSDEEGAHSTPRKQREAAERAHRPPPKLASPFPQPALQFAAAVGELKPTTPKTDESPRMLPPKLRGDDVHPRGRRRLNPNISAEDREARRQERQRVKRTYERETKEMEEQLLRCSQTHASPSTTC